MSRRVDVAMCDPVYFMSTLRRTGALSVTETAWRFSPSCGLRNTTSCGPIAIGRLPIGVSPTRRPSIQTSAQGDALRLIAPCGSSRPSAATLPGGTTTTRFGAEAERVVHDLQLVPAGGEHDPIGVGRADQPAPSRISIATGDFTDSQPETGPADAVATGASTDEVTPAWMTTC